MRIAPVMLCLLTACSGTPVVDAGTGGGGASAGGGTVGGGSAAGGGSATGGGGNVGGGNAGLALADYCAQSDAARCAMNVRCGTAVAGTDCQKILLPSRFALTNARTDCLGSIMRAGLDAGHTVYDAVKAQACVTALSTTAECNLTFPFAPECVGVFTGTIPLGQPCIATSDCEVGLYCNSSAQQCPGTCRTAVIGPTTGGPGSCAFGTFPVTFVDGGLQCVSWANRDSPCQPPPDALNSVFCIGANSCQSTSDGGRTCLPFRTVGAACSIFGNDCGPGTTCGPGSDGGQQCLRFKQSGESCDPNRLGIPCELGLSCVSGTCGPLVALNGACSDDADCLAGLLCEQGTCKPFGSVGMSCSTNFLDSCGVGLFCNSAHQCEARRGRDAACTRNECNLADGLTCSANSDGGMRCLPQVCLP